MNKYAFIKPGAIVKLRNGNKAEIYARKRGQKFCFMGATKEGEWLPRSWNEIGKATDCGFAEPDDIVAPWKRGGR